jgi:pimeloyl-ACP methyl ester carboxylesterase
MGTLSLTAPPVAAILAERMFLRPPARRLRGAEAAWAREARTTVLEGPVGPIRTWLWEGGPRTVLLAHGWGGRGPQLGAVARALVGRGYSALAWDMPGHGDPAGSTNLLEMAAVMSFVARGVGDVAGVVAHSFGTATTLATAARHGLAPERLVAVAPAAFLERIAGSFAAMTGFTPSVVARMRTRLSRRLGFAWDDLEADTVAPRLRCPVLVVHDRDDARIPFEQGADLARLLQASELVETSGLGHRGPLDEPAVTGRIADFFTA